MKESLSRREQQVLWATVNHYVATAEPVGSKVLAESYTLNVSPATIRTIMSSLDRSGLLYQPHPSAGRVPSEIGYRVYVDNLIQSPTSLTSDIEKLITDKLGEHRSANLEGILQQVAQILATLCGCIALITAPGSSPDRVRHVQLVILDPHQALLILVSHAYQTASVRVEFTEDVSHFLATFNNFLNAQLRNRLCSALLPLAWDDLDQEVRGFIRNLESSLKLLEQEYHASQPLWVSGLKELLKQPEFSQLEQVHPIVQFLEEGTDSLVPILAQSEGRPCVKIGKELGLKPMQNCTLISSMYHQADSPVGWVSILGPTRLPYEKAIASVEAAATKISEILGQRG